MRPFAEILTIGNELLKGSTVNTNAAFLGRELTQLGYEVLAQTSCRDQISEIHDHLAAALRRAEVVVLSGGLGPTPDDLTRDAVAEYFKTPLQLSNRQYSFIKNYYRKRKKSMPAMVKKEALFPKGSIPLFNRFGIALGFYLVRNKKTVIVLPGVPDELEKMFQHLVIPVLLKAQKKCGVTQRFKLTVKTVGLTEPNVMLKLGRDFFDDVFDFGIYPEAGEVTIRLYSDSRAVIKRLQRKIRQRLPAQFVYAFEEKRLNDQVGALLLKKKKTVAVAESCTGGLLAAEISKVPGASGYFKGSVTAYHPEVKCWLGISPELMKRAGTVSKDVAEALASLASTRLKADYGIGITGVAGPAKENGQPLGRVYIAISGKDFLRSWEENFWGERNQVQARAVKKALEYLWREIR